MTEDLRAFIEDELGVGDEPADEVEEVSEEESDAFYATLTPEQLARAEDDEDYRDALYAAWADEADDDPDEDEATEDDEEGGESEATPRTSAEVVAWAYANEAGLTALGWANADEFLVRAASDARWWHDAARELGIPYEARPTGRDLPAGLEMHAIAAGIPGARVMADPLHRQRPSSPRRLW